MAETNNTTSNTTAADENKVGASKKRLKSSKVNDELAKGGKTMTGSPIDKINMHPVQEAAEHTAVTNLNMRAQPVHKGHVKVIKAVEAEAKRVGGSAHIVTSHSEGDEKNPIPTSKKVGYLKKVASPSTHVSSTSREAYSPLHTAARLNRSAHHLVVVAGSDRADEYHKLLHKYNGKEGPHGYYNFKSITVKKIDRDPDAEGTKGVSGTKMREHAKNGNISAFKSGLPPELHQHAEEMMGDINKASKKKVKEDIDDLFNAAMMIDTDDTHSLLDAIEEAYNRADTSKREWGTQSLTKIYKKDTPGERFGKRREVQPRDETDNQDRTTLDFVTRRGEDRKTDDRPYRYQSIVKKIVDEAMRKTPADKIRAAMKSRGVDIDSTKHRDEMEKNNAAYKKILDGEADEKKKKANEAFEQIDEISDKLVGRVNRLRSLGPDVSKGTPPKPHKTEAGYKTLKNAVDKAAGVKKTGEYKLPKVEEAKSLDRDFRTEAKAPKWDEKEFNLVRSGMWRHHTGDSSIHYGGDSKSYTVMHGNDRDPVKYRTLDGAQKAVRAKLKEDKKMYKCPECGAPVEKKGMNCGACHENMKEEVVQEKRGLWDNIWAKRKRIKNGSGEHMRKPGSKGAPTNKDFKDSQ